MSYSLIQANTLYLSLSLPASVSLSLGPSSREPAGGQAAARGVPAPLALRRRVPVRQLRRAQRSGFSLF